MTMIIDTFSYIVVPIAIGTTNNETDSRTAPRYSVIPAEAGMTEGVVRAGSRIKSGMT